MRALLFFPPISDPTFPPHGIARLAGFLRARGREVATHDLNVAFVHHALGPLLDRVESELEASVAALDAREALSSDDWDRYRMQARALLVAGPVRENVDAAKAVMQQRAWFDDPGTYNWAHHVLETAWRVISARYHPTAFGFHNWSSGAPLELAEVQRCTAPGADEPFRAFFADRVPELIPDGPAWAGISVMFLDQLVPALLLAEAIRAARPDVRIALGGALITHLADQGAVLLDAYPALDALVLGAGEVPFLELLDGGRPSGVLYRGAPAPSQAEVHRYDVKDSPPPYYEPAALASYLAPEPVLSIRGSRGCYWGRCVYCSHHLGEGRYAPRSPDDAFAEVQHLRATYGARTFYLSDDALSPRFLRRLSDLLLAAEPDGVTARWFGDARPEDLDEALIAHAARAGLVMLFLGVESANARVRGLMQRGELARVRDTIAACHRHGVILKLNFIFGFPGETDAELEETLAFIAEVRAPADIVSTTPFYLTRGSPLQLHRLPIPGFVDVGPTTRRSGLDAVDVAIRPQAPGDLTLMYDFETSSGRTAQQTIDAWTTRLATDPRARAFAWRTSDLSRVHRALQHHLHRSEDFAVGGAVPVDVAPEGSLPPAVAAGDAVIRTRPPVRSRTFRYNLVARGGASRITPTAFVCDELLRFPNPSGESTLAGVHPALGALIDGELRAGLSRSALDARLATIPEGARAVEVLLRIGLLEVVDA